MKYQQYLMRMVYKLKWDLMDNRWDFGRHQERKVLIISVSNLNKQNQTKLYIDTKIQKRLYHGTMTIL
jgi:hypothetical protein